MGAPRFGDGALSSRTSLNASAARTNWPSGKAWKATAKSSIVRLALDPHCSLSRKVQLKSQVLDAGLPGRADSANHRPKQKRDKQKSHTVKTLVMKLRVLVMTAMPVLGLATPKQRGLQHTSAQGGFPESPEIATPNLAFRDEAVPP